MRSHRTPGIAEPRRTTTLVLASLLLLAAAVGPAARAQAEQQDSGSLPKYRVSAVQPNQHLLSQRDSIRATLRSLGPSAANRSVVFEGIRRLLAQQARFLDRVAQTEPRNQFAWLMITDYAADTLAYGLGPLVDRYAGANPEEILTEGRQLIELETARMPPAPNRMLGFHVVMLGNFLYDRADSLLLRGRTADRAGVEDGVLRWLQDWLGLFAQAHADETQKHISHIKHEDWVLVRLQDNCGNQGADVWKLKQMFMALIETDSSRTPPVERYAHEFRLASSQCPQDERLVYFDLPYLQPALLEAARQARLKDEEIQKEQGRQRGESSSP